MSNNHGVQSTSPSRRSVVKGAAWAVPAVVVAGAAPTVAASNGPLEFTGGACKLPGNATDVLKGYVFELTANNTTGPLPTIGITVISNVKINSTAVSGFNVSIRGASPTCSGVCATTSCGAPAAHAFCTPDGAQQQILVYTADKPTGNSQNAEMSLCYQRYDCFSGSCTPIDLAPVCITSGIHSTPPATEGGGSCNVTNVFPIPTTM
ncbi:hypothetical protein ACWEOW_24240 [Monashia sp. NPDC004114]